MTNRARDAVGSAAAALVLTFILGGFFLKTWTDGIVVFLIFTIGLFIGTGGLSDRE